MLIALFKLILSVLAAFAGIYALLSLVCHVSDHDGLIMLHMYFTPIILSAAFALILILTPKRLSTGNRAPKYRSVEL